MEYPNKEISTAKAGRAKKGEALDVQETEFMFPHSPSPILVRAKDIGEANEKFAAIINKEK